MADAQWVKNLECPQVGIPPRLTLFVVWQEARENDLGAGGFRLGRDARAIFGVPPHNVFLAKLAYWLNA